MQAGPISNGDLHERPAAFGLNVDPNAGGLAIAARIAAIAPEDVARTRNMTGPWLARHPRR